MIVSKNYGIPYKTVLEEKTARKVHRNKIIRHNVVNKLRTLTKQSLHVYRK